MKIQHGNKYQTEIIKVKQYMARNMYQTEIMKIQEDMERNTKQK